MTAAPEVIRADESYSVAEFKRRLGVQDFAFRQLRRGGLRVIHPAGTKKPFILGSDWIDFLRQSAAETEGASQ